MKATPVPLVKRDTIIELFILGSTIIINYHQRAIVVIRKARRIIWKGRTDFQETIESDEDMKVVVIQTLTIKNHIKEEEENRNPVIDTLRRENEVIIGKR